MTFWSKQSVYALCVATILAGCGDVSYVQKNSPANPFKDYRPQGSAVIGIGKPISEQQMQANAVFSAKGNQSLEEVIEHMAGTYNVAVRWGSGVRKNVRQKIVIEELTFDELRSYIEDVYDVQIIREGERRILVLPSLAEARIQEFSPGINITLSQAVRGLAEECGMNLVITENRRILAETQVTTSLRDVSCRDAMEALLNPHGLSLVDTGDYYTIGGFPTREWVLNLHEPQRSETQETNFSTTTEGGGDQGSSSSGASTNLSINTTREVWADLEEDLSSLIDKSCEEGDAAASEAAEGGFLPPPSLLDGQAQQQDATAQNNNRSSGGGEGSYICGYVRVNPSVGLVQMRAPVHVLETADAIIKRVEDIASRRLMVEARVMAVNRSRGFEQNLNLQGALFNNNVTNISGGFEPTIQAIDFSVTGKLAELVSETGGGFLGVTNQSISAVAKLLEQFGTTYQFMSPTVEVMDRQRAILVDGRNEKYFIVENDTSTTEAGTNTEQSVDERTQFVGVQFTVTAQIAEEGEPHTLHVQIPITDIERFVTEPVAGGQVPIVTNRIIDQKVRVRDGEIKVIGGLNRTLAIDRESGVPLLRGIPVTGKLFNEEDISYEDVEFVVLLTARRIY